MRQPSSQRDDSAITTSSGLTVMVIRDPGQKARRMHIPRWLIFAAAFAWLSIMTAAFVWGFESAAPSEAEKGTRYGPMRTAMMPAPSSRQ